MASNYPPSELERALEGFQQELLRNERKAASEVVRVYATAWHRIQDQIDRLQSEYNKALAQGITPGVTWIYEMGRALEFREQVAEQMLKFSRYAEKSTQAQIRDAIRQAENSSKVLTRMSIGKPPRNLTIPWNRLPTESVLQIIGATRPNSPLHRLFESIHVQGTQAAEEALVQGLLMGKNPRETAPLIRRALGVQLSRALTIARTETLRAYREATRLNFQNNSNIVTGWIWHSALEDRTCIFCLAMHGTYHSLDERLNEHPNGRCAMVPVTKTWNEIFPGLQGVEETRVNVPPGDEYFKTLSESRQRELLGDDRYQMWKSQGYSLRDFVKFKWNSTWGATPAWKTKSELELRGE